MFILTIFVHTRICIHSFRRCYTRFGAYPYYIQIKMIVKATHKCFQRGEKRKKKTHTHR
jgi:hypothetical protein